MKILRFCLLFLSALLFIQSIHASNVSFLQYSAMNFFRGNDMAMMRANAERALNKNKDGVKSTWRNSSTGAWGYAVPSNTKQQNGKTCRSLKIFNEARQVTGEANYKLCKQNNKWVFAE